nr:hypothetical protein GCM10010200_075800 [Actinomadura rugatobispora]
MLAAAVGLQIQKPEPDCDGIDFGIRYPGARSTIYLPQIDVQVKSWRTPQGNSDNWRYPLKIAHFNQLAGAFDMPRYLILVVVPDDPAEYTEVTGTGLTLRWGAYWEGYHGIHPILDRPREKKITVDVPKANLLTAKSLLSLMIRPGVGGVAP